MTSAQSANKKYQVEPGTPLAQLDTPSVLVDSDLVEENIETLMNTFRPFPNVKIRPHQKTAKCPQFAKLLIERGASGICVAKISEAEIFVDAGIHDILITTEFAGNVKIDWFLRLWERAPEVRIVVDNAKFLQALDAAISKSDKDDGTQGKLSILIDLNVGQDRTGVGTIDEALQLAREISAHPNLTLIGIQGYEGHLQHLAAEERAEKCRASMEKLIEAANTLRSASYKIDVVTTGGTGTGDICANCDGITEVQPGSFIFSDVAYRKATAGKYKNALTVLTTVISKPAPNRAVVDAGTKSLSIDMGYAEPKERPDWTYRPAGDEHGIIESKSGDVELQVGDKLELIPGHIDTTVALHDEFHVLRKGKVEDVWRILARGKVM